MVAFERFSIDLAKNFSIINTIINDSEFSAKFSYILFPVDRGFWAGLNNLPGCFKKLYYSVLKEPHHFILQVRQNWRTN